VPLQHLREGGGLSNKRFTRGSAHRPLGMAMKG
jgi:hypothetical protein